MISLDIEALPNNGKKRRLRKVYYAYYDYECGPPHPVIRLGGRYLEAFNFKIGDRIEVQLDSGRIVITKICDPAGNDKA